MTCYIPERVVPLVDDHFLGRQRYEGGRALMRGLVIRRAVEAAML